MSVLIGRHAPDFIAPAVLGNGEIKDQFNFYQDTEGKYKLVVFYPLDFTFVCPSELIALDRRYEEFEKRNVEIITVSVDSHFTHNAWRNTPINVGGIGQVKYTMIADISHAICRSYGVEHMEASVALRGAFIVDKENIVRSMVVNDLPIGRNMGELLRCVDALQFHEEFGEVCPANWQKGEQGMSASPEGVAQYLSQYEETL